jgi:hypothetical protein
MLLALSLIAIYNVEAIAEKRGGVIFDLRARVKR